MSIIEQDDHMNLTRFPKHGAKTLFGRTRDYGSIGEIERRKLEF